MRRHGGGRENGVIGYDGSENRSQWFSYCKADVAARIPEGQSVIGCLPTRRSGKSNWHVTFASGGAFGSDIALKKEGDKQR